jgi:hypothetical protein
MRRSVVWVWPVALTVAVVGPLLRPGYVLTYDMVFVPDQAWRIDYLGVGPAVPRAVPSDALVSVASTLLPGEILQKLFLVAILLGAGLGMWVLTRGLPLFAQLAAIAWFGWNPFVAERLVIGQWVMLLGYAALPWVAASAVAVRRGSTAGCAGLVLATGVAAWSASGGILAACLGLTLLSWWGSAASRAQRLVVGAAVLMVNAPWIVAGALHHEDVGTSSTAVEAFAASGEGHLAALPTVLGLGGIWNVDVVPDSRLTWVAVGWLVVLLGVVAVGLRPMVEHFGAQVTVALGVVAAACLVISLAGTVDVDLVARLSGDVPGFALFRDGSRYLGGLALFEAIAFGLGTARLAALPPDRVIGTVVGAGLSLAPLAALPDLAWGVGARLSPVDYPESWVAARAALAADAGRGTVLVYPDAPYRAYGWNDRRPGLDPAPRYFPGRMLNSDALTVDGVEVQVDDPITAAAMQAYEDGDAQRLSDLGVGYVVVDVDPARSRDDAVAVGARPVYSGDDISVYALAKPRDVPVPRGEVVAMASAWLVSVVALGGAALIGAWSWARRSRRTAPPT